MFTRAKGGQVSAELIVAIVLAAYLAIVILAWVRIRRGKRRERMDE